jgi:hypothetical protein
MLCQGAFSYTNKEFLLPITNRSIHPQSIAQIAVVTLVERTQQPNSWLDRYNLPLPGQFVARNFLHIKLFRKLKLKRLYQKAILPQDYFLFPIPRLVYISLLPEPLIKFRQLYTCFSLKIAMICSCLNLVPRIIYLLFKRSIMPAL